MTQEIIYVGATANDGQGDPLRTAFTKTNNNFSQLFTASSDGYSDIHNGNSNVSVIANGNITMSTSGTSNVMVVSNTIVRITGDLSVTGNASLTGNILADRILNGNTTIGIPVINSNVVITIGATSNVAVFATTGTYVKGLVSVNSANSAGAVIVNAGGNAVGNIGSSTGYFNRVWAASTAAIYSDLAEVYAADAYYEPGTVVSFGGTNEVTLSQIVSDQRVAGVISTNPSYIMNNGLTADHRAVVALTGRVPTSVTGMVTKGDMMISAGNGCARACASPAMGTVIGKALQNFNGENGVIEIVVGRM